MVIFSAISNNIETTSQFIDLSIQLSIQNDESKIRIYLAGWFTLEMLSPKISSSFQFILNKQALVSYQYVSMLLALEGQI